MAITLKHLLEEADGHVEPWLDITLMNSKADQLVVRMITSEFLKVEYYKYDVYYKYDASNERTPFLLERCEWVRRGNREWSFSLCKKYNLDPMSVDWHVGQKVFDQIDRIHNKLNSTCEYLKKYRGAK